MTARNKLRLDDNAFDATPVIDRLNRRLLDMRPAMRPGAERWSDLVVEEIEGQFWRPPSGGRRAWAARKPFGSKRPAASPFGTDYIAAWRGGPGRVLRVARDRVDFGVAGSRFPWIGYQRGGFGSLRAGDVVGQGTRVSSARQRRTWKIAKGRTASSPAPQKWAIFWKLGLSFGVWLSARKLADGLFIPFRPHATINPEVKTSVTAIFAAHVAGRPLPRRFGAADRIGQGAPL